MEACSVEDWIIQVHNETRLHHKESVTQVIFLFLCHREDICLQILFLLLNVQHVKQKNPLFNQPIVLRLAY